MSFKVVPASVSKFGTELEGLKTDADEAKTYAAKTKPAVSGVGAIVRFLNSCQDVRPAVEEFFGHLSSISHSSGAELHAAAKKYKTLDAEAAARLDAKYPKG
ncbi:hypothetical protein JNB_11804 [Janibacter sp. HTCC2649]|uniref:hypothetical protein n=1 Tax=Janibacter sp. HTCC2649 TaxID=313589 RepID=UPI0000670A92|nr:hypothetical protein [Janibacter sp. HTCC2649]EAQ00858.1 hypothetical protein JNB_11804 [Janibacter sp. HTCC2649]